MTYILAEDECWNCLYPRAEHFRYCPNCGLWLMNAKPIRSLQGVALTVLMDDRSPARPPEPT